MQQLKEICTKDMNELVKSLRESESRDMRPMLKERDPRPSEYGNRKQRRAAKAIAKKEIVYV